jgi:hypothetical protein
MGRSNRTTGTAAARGERYRLHSARSMNESEVTVLRACWPRHLTDSRLIATGHRSALLILALFLFRMPNINRYRNLAGERRVVNLSSSKPSRSQHPASDKRTASAACAQVLGNWVSSVF